MSKILLGVVLTLAVLYPAVTKNLLNSAVDTAHNTVTTVMQNSQSPAQ